MSLDRSIQSHRDGAARTFDVDRRMQMVVAVQHKLRATALKDGQQLGGIREPFVSLGRAQRMMDQNHTK